MKSPSVKPLSSLLFAAALSVAGPLLAQTNVEIEINPAPAPEAAAPDATPAAPAESAAPVAPSSETPVLSKKKSSVAGDQKGKIAEIDSTAGTFVVEGKTFKLSPHGRVEVDGALMSLSDLKVGDRVAVTYFEMTNGDNLATRVIKGYAMKRAKKGKKAKGQ